MSEVKPSVPEPAPKPGREDVTPALIAWMEERASEAYMDGERGTFYGEAARLVRQRDALGRSKYGTGLMTHNGRDPVEDARQESGDKMNYTEQAFMEGRDLSALVRLLAVEATHLVSRAKESGADLDPIRRLLPVLNTLVNPEPEWTTEQIGSTIIHSRPLSPYVLETIRRMEGKPPVPVADDAYFKPRLPTPAEVDAWKGHDHVWEWRRHDGTKVQGVFCPGGFCPVGPDSIGVYPVPESFRADLGEVFRPAIREDGSWVGHHWPLVERDAYFEPRMPTVAEVKEWQGEDRAWEIYAPIGGYRDVLRLHVALNSVRTPNGETLETAWCDGDTIRPVERICGIWVGHQWPELDDAEWQSIPPTHEQRTAIPTWEVETPDGGRRLHYYHRDVYRNWQIKATTLDGGEAWPVITWRAGTRCRPAKGNGHG